MNYPFPPDETKLVFVSPQFSVHFCIRSFQPKNFRRQIAKQIYRTVKKSLRDSATIFITHADSKCSLQLLKDTQRQVSEKSICQFNRGLTFRLIRMELGWTLREMSKKTGLTPARLSLIERGRVRPQAKSILAIEKFLFDEGKRLSPYQSETKRKIAEHMRLWKLPKGYVQKDLSNKAHSL